MEERDPGLARERMALAWTRTAASVAALDGAVLSAQIVGFSSPCPHGQAGARGATAPASSALIAHQGIQRLVGAFDSAATRHSS
jgi:hypothetical protein